MFVFALTLFDTYGGVLSLFDYCYFRMFVVSRKPVWAGRLLVHHALKNKLLTYYV